MKTTNCTETEFRCPNLMKISIFWFYFKGYHPMCTRFPLGGEQSFGQCIFSERKLSWNSRGKHSNSHECYLYGMLQPSSEVSQEYVQQEATVCWTYSWLSELRIRVSVVAIVRAGVDELGYTLYRYACSHHEILILHAVCFKMIPIKWWYNVPPFGRSSAKFWVA